MRPRSSALLEAVFSLALAACREKASVVAPPTPTSALADASASTATVAPTSASAASAEPTSTVTERPDELRPGQACSGSIVPALHPAVPVDYLELRLDYYPQRAHEVVIAGHSGSPCAKARDVAACTQALAKAQSPDSGEYLVYTRGDEVGTVTGRAAAAFLAPIDSPEEAALAVVYDYRAGKSVAEVFPPCDASSFTRTKAGFQTSYTQTMLCEERRSWTIAIDRAGKISTADPSYTPPRPDCQRPFLGRKPEGFALPARGAPITLGSYFSDCAEMETASIFAFRRLERELGAAAAPRSLRARATRSARDEARHAHVMRRLAARFGEAPRPIEIAPHEPRALLTMALENAVEGCVFETWAALLAAFQAERAADPRIRAALRSIARDEQRHAALAWDVAAWLDAQLTSEERASVECARHAALAELRQNLEHEPAPELHEIAGLPSTAEATLLFAHWRALFASERAA